VQFVQKAFTEKSEFYTLTYRKSKQVIKVWGSIGDQLSDE